MGIINTNGTTDIPLGRMQKYLKTKIEKGVWRWIFLTNLATLFQLQEKTD